MNDHSVTSIRVSTSYMYTCICAHRCCSASWSRVLNALMRCEPGVTAAVVIDADCRRHRRRRRRRPFSCVRAQYLFIGTRAESQTTVEDTKSV